MKSNPKEIVYVIDQSKTIRGAIDLFLRRDYEVITFVDYHSFNEHIQSQNEFLPYILLVESSSADKIARSKNNIVIILDNEIEKYLDFGDLVVSKPFSREYLNDVVKKAEINLKTAEIFSNKETLEKELPINDFEDKRKIKV